MITSEQEKRKIEQGLEKEKISHFDLIQKIKALKEEKNKLEQEKDILEKKHQDILEKERIIEKQIEIISAKEKETVNEKQRRQIERERREAGKRREQTENERWDIEVQKEQLLKKINEIERLYQLNLTRVKQEKEGEKEESRRETLKRIKQEPSEIFGREEKPSEEKIIFRPLPQKPSFSQKVWVRALLLGLVIALFGILLTFWYWYLYIHIK